MKRDNIITGAVMGVAIAAWMYAGVLSVAACTAPQGDFEDGQEKEVIIAPPPDAEAPTLTLKDPTDRELIGLGMVLVTAMFIAWTRRKK